MAFNVKFGATDAGFTSTVKKVNESTKGIGTNVKSVSGTVKASFASMVKAGAALAIGFGAIKAAAAALRNTFATFKGAVDMGSQISDVATRTGIAADQVVILQRAFENGGLSAESMGKSVNRMQRSLVEAGQGMTTPIRALESLGISLDHIKDKSPSDQFDMIGKAIAAIQDPAQRSAAAMQIFGRSGAEMMTIFRDGDAIDVARAQLGSLPSIMMKVNETFDKTSDNLKAIGNKFKELAAGILSEVAPALELVTTLLSRIDAAAIGAKLARVFVGGTEAMKGFSDALAALKLGEFTIAFKIAFASIKLQAAQTVNSIGANIRGLFASIPVFLEASGIMGIFQNLISGIANKLSAALRGAMAEFLRSIGKIKSAMEMEMFSKADSDRADNYFTMVKGGLSMIADNTADASAAAKKAYIDARDAAEDMIDTTKLEIGLQKTKAELINSAGFGQFDMSKDIKEIEKIPEFGWDMRNHVEQGAAAMVKAAATVKATLALSAQIVAKIKEAAAKDKVDPGGRLEKRANEAIEQGKFGVAERAAKRIARREDEVDIQVAFGGKNKFGKSIKDIAQEQGIDTFRKSSRELRTELAALAKKRQEEMAPGAAGMNKDEAAAAAAGQGKADPMTTISAAVEIIKNLVAKIEPKLPTAALGA